MAYRIALLVVSLALTVCPSCYAGTITITERESSAANSLFAGSGGTVDTSDESDDTSALTGPFSFSDSNSVAVSAASASGSIEAADNVVQTSSSSFSVTATRTATGSANHISGTGNAFSNQTQEVRVQFTVNGDDARYTLTGDFDPGVITTIIGDTHSVELYRPFTSFNPVNVDEAATLNETGELIANRTYELRIRVSDRNSASSNSPSASDSSSFNIQFNVFSIPEPTTAFFGCLGSLFFLAARSRAGAR
jgi:hypothetical protein